MAVISVTGASWFLVALPTFPAGIEITNLADDTDPILWDRRVIAETAKGLNGDLVAWSRPTNIRVTLAVIEGTDSDRELSLLLDLNSIAIGKVSNNDVITLTQRIPDRPVQTFTNGRLVEGDPATSALQSGRSQTKSYVFEFESKLTGG